MAFTAERSSSMVLYSDPGDPVSQSVRLVLAEKAINVDVLQVTPGDEPEDLKELNPYGAVLTLVDRDLVLYEPQIIMEYLDERFPHPPLMPVDPVARATNRLLRYRVQRDLYPLHVSIARGTKEAAAAARRELKDHLTAIAPLFAQTRFFLADEFSLADCMLSPLLWRLPYYDVRLGAQARELLRYADRMFEREAFDASLSEYERELRLR